MPISHSLYRRLALVFGIAVAVATLLNGTSFDCTAELAWETDVSAVATVDGWGVVYAHDVGTATME